MNGIYIMPQDGICPENPNILIFKLNQYSVQQIKEKTKNLTCTVYGCGNNNTDINIIIDLFNNNIKFLRVNSEDDVIIKNYLILHHLLKNQPTFDFEAELYFS